MRSPLKRPPPRTAGQHLDKQLNDLVDDKLATWILAPLLLWYTALMEWLATLRDQPRMPGTYAALAVVVTVIAVGAIIRLRRHAADLKLGRDGEREVGHILSTLDVPGTRLFHDVPAEGFNLDHVIACDRGVFVIETKTWRVPEKSQAKLTVKDGCIYKHRVATTQPVEQAVSEARWLAARLKQMTGRDFPCWPVVVTPGWHVQEPLDSGTKSRAWVLNPLRLLGYIQHEPVRLGREDVHLIAERLGVLVRGEGAPT